MTGDRAEPSEATAENNLSILSTSFFLFSFPTTVLSRSSISFSNFAICPAYALRTALSLVISKRYRA